MATPKKTIKKAVAPKAAVSVSTRFKPISGRGEFVFLIGTKECHIVPSMGALSSIEADTDTYFNLMALYGNNQIPMSYLVKALYHMNKGDPVTEDDIMFHMTGMMFKDRSGYQTLVNNCVQSLFDPTGTVKQTVELDEGEDLETNHPN